MTAPLLAAGERNILLSPHSDDIAFSLGNAVRTAARATMITLFTASAHIAGEAMGMPPEPRRIAEVSALRRAEDEAFADRLALQRLELDLWEPALHGRTHRDIGGVAPDTDLLRAPLLDVLERLLAEPGPVCLLSPAGIGGHSNHLATRAVVIEALPMLEARGVRVLFYEDLPYAHALRQRRRGVAALHRALPGRRLVRRTQVVAQRAEKLELINLYPSQVRGPEVSLARYSPAAIWPLRPHEAAWELQRA